MASADTDIQLLDQPVWYLAPPEVANGGGECAFLGRTRREVHPKHGELIRLSYEAYTPLAERTLRELAAAATERFGCLFVRLHHAVCEVPPAEASVLVQVVCGHRAEAFEACRYLIDALKRDVPIWKREVWADGTTWAQGQSPQIEREVE